MSHKKGPPRWPPSWKKVLTTISIVTLVGLLVWGISRCGASPSKPEVKDAAATTPSSSPAPAGSVAPAAAGVSTASPTPVVVSGTGDIIFGPGETIKIVELVPGKLSPCICIPPIAKQYSADVRPATGFWVQFLDGHRQFIKPEDHVWFPERRGIFWLEGTTKGQIATITIEPQDGYVCGHEQPQTAPEKKDE